jgi:hypothetical protein
LLREDADHVRASIHFLVQALQFVGRMQRARLFRKAEPWPTGPKRRFRLRSWGEWLRKVDPYWV